MHLRLQRFAVALTGADDKGQQALGATELTPVKHKLGRRGLRGIVRGAQREHGVAEARLWRPGVDGGDGFKLQGAQSPLSSLAAV